jgi:hypothetical protein
VVANVIVASDCCERKTFFRPLAIARRFAQQIGHDRTPIPIAINIPGGDLQ